MAAPPRKPVDRHNPKAITTQALVHGVTHVINTTEKFINKWLFKHVTFLSTNKYQVSFFLKALLFTNSIKNTKDMLPGTSTGLTHKQMCEVTFDIDKTQKTSCLGLLQVLLTRRTYEVTFNIYSKKEKTVIMAVDEGNYTLLIFFSTD